MSGSARRQRAEGRGQKGIKTFVVYLLDAFARLVILAVIQ
jgi:hypothetical protein